MHGVGLSIATPDGLNPEYLRRLEELTKFLKPRFVSDHLAWVRLGRYSSHDLLPVALHERSLKLICERVDQVQQKIGQRFYLENPTAYLNFTSSKIPEPEFLRLLCDRTGCGVLLDINNLIVNEANFGIDPLAYLEYFRPGDICYFHVAGHQMSTPLRVDTHDQSVPTRVLELAAIAKSRFPDAGILLERDDNLPDFEILVNELASVKMQVEKNEPKLSEFTRSHGKRPLPHTENEQAVDDWGQVAKSFWRLAFPSDLSLDYENSKKHLDGSGLLVDAGIQIYRDAYKIRLKESLATNFSATIDALGPATFDTIYDKYLATYPPDSFAICDFGKNLPGFLLSNLADRFFGDLAQCEWARIHVQECDEFRNRLTLEELANLDPESWPALKFTFSADHLVFSCSYPVISCLSADWIQLDLAKIAARDEYYLIYRQSGSVFHETVSKSEFQFYHEFRAGKNFEDAAACLSDHEEERVSLAAPILVRWISREMILAPQFSQNP